MIIHKNANLVFRRLDELYSGKGKNKIYASIFQKGYHRINTTSTYDKDGKVIYSEPDDSNYISFLNKCNAFSEMDDDSFPYYYLNDFDEAIYAVLFGARSVFSDMGDRVSSISYPFILDYDEVKNFKLNENHLWIQRLKCRLEYCARHLKGIIGISDFINISGLNFAVAIRGATEAYMAVIEEPEKMKCVINFSVDLNIWLREIFYNIIGLQNGGSYIFNQWFPGKIINESVDAYHMTSADTFDEYGKDSLEKIFTHFDGGVLHLHGNGRHLLKSVSALKGLKLLNLGDDEPFPRAHDVLDDLSEKRGKVPIHLSIPYDVFIKRFKANDLPGNILYSIYEIPDNIDKQTLIDEIRAYKT